jgi:hypothetical protein
MSVAKIQPPRKLTDDEDLDTFEDWWFQFISYYCKDAIFKPILEDESVVWQSVSVQHRGLTTAAQCANLNSLLRSMATYAAGPYIKTSILNDTTCVADIKRTFMKFLEIELSDLTLLDYYQVMRKPNERPLRFFYRLRHHAYQHLLPKGALVDGKALQADEKWTPTLERLNIMEWLRRLDPRLIPYIKEKFSTELSSSSTHLMSLVETLAKNVDHYITWINQNQSSSSANAVSRPDLSHPTEQFPWDQQELPVHPSDVCFQQRGRGFGRGYPRSRPGGRGQGPRGRGGYGYRPARFNDCEYCYVQAKVHGKNVDFRHNIKTCPQLTQVFQPGVNFVNEMIEGDGHPFDTAFEEEYDEEAPYNEGGFYGATQ